MIDRSASYESLPTHDVAVSVPADTASRSKKILAEICLAIGISVTWAFGRQFTKSALIIDSGHFYAPYFLVWFNTSFMILCYPVFTIYNFLFNKKTFSESYENARLIFKPNGPTPWTFLKLETPFLILWMLANYTYSQALGYISASAAIVLVSSNIAMICMLERILLGQKLNFTRITAVILAMGGVALTSADGEHSGSWLGVFISVVSAVFVALYKVLFKLINGCPDFGQTSLFLSGLGMLNLLLNIFPMILLTLFNLEHIEVNYIPWKLLIAAALLSTVFNFLTNFGIALIGPFAISVGMLLGIPISAIIDVIVRSMGLTIWFLIGSLAICLSFALVVFPADDLCRRLKNNFNASK